MSGFTKPQTGGGETFPPLLPPPPLTVTQSQRAMASQKAKAKAKQKDLVRGLWEAWVLDEPTKYATRSVFTKVVAQVFSNAGQRISSKLVEEWIDGWETEWIEPYGVISRADGPQTRGYGGHATTIPVRGHKQ